MERGVFFDGEGVSLMESGFFGMERGFFWMERGFGKVGFV